MKYLILSAMILSITACGKGAGGGSGTGRSGNSNEVRPHCEITNSKSDLFSIAASANRARVECGLKEDKVIELFGILSP